ncbi:MAG: iron permease [Caldilinea sp. CFX5]|nr:iron permease [Caldilinea sp. CFX5]
MRNAMFKTLTAWVMAGILLIFTLAACSGKTDAVAMSNFSGAALSVFTSTVVLVFRESLEAYLILAALLASMVGAYAHYRRPVLVGAALAVLFSGVTWVAFHWLLLAYAYLGRQLEALVALLVIAVLLLTMNWFFHKSYWNNWIARFHRQKQRFVKRETRQWLGLLFLGFASIYREGLEIVLFLQPFVLEAGLGIVMQGVTLGLLGIVGLGLLAWRSPIQLHYKKLLIVTGILVGVVLIMLMGQSVDLLQTLGWLPATPLPAAQSWPAWLSVWFDIYPTWQGLGAPIGGAVFVIGSYYLAEYLQQRKRPQSQPKKEDNDPAIKKQLLPGNN